MKNKPVDLSSMIEVSSWHRPPRYRSPINHVEALAETSHSIGV